MVINGYHGNELITQSAPTSGNCIRWFCNPDMIRKLLIYDNLCYFFMHTYSLNKALLALYLQHYKSLFQGIAYVVEKVFKCKIVSQLPWQ